ncbi:hypothetical protein T492DRAFT_105746 [Pavlovales sp. CCMP2436]|nr:hypothetical protein T492DRAFT_105746 [Pavlovales sp. CCMP2436]
MLHAQCEKRTSAKHSLAAHADRGADKQPHSLFPVPYAGRPGLRPQEAPHQSHLSWDPPSDTSYVVSAERPRARVLAVSHLPVLPPANQCDLLALASSTSLLHSYGGSARTRVVQALISREGSSPAGSARPMLQARSLPLLQARPLSASTLQLVLGRGDASRPVSREQPSPSPPPARSAW